ncbi:MAG: restriction endonuclease subunit S [Eubacteriales bacterium]
MERHNKLPQNWILTKVNKIGKIETGTTPSKKEKENYGDDFPFYKPTELESGINVKDSREKLSKIGIKKARIIPKNSILVTCIGATIGKTGLIRKEGAFNQQINAIIPYIGVNPYYVYYQTISHFFKKQIIKNASSTTLPILNKSRFSKLSFLLPPLNEQNRIVEKIEELFSELDKATEDLQKVREQLKVYRQSILKAAFEGELIGKGSYDYISFSKICDINPPKKEINNINGNLEVTFLPMSLLSTSGTMLKGEVRKLKNVIKGYTYFRNGDVLLAKITPCFENGKRAIARELKNGIGFGSTEFHVLRPRDKVISEWVFYGISFEGFRNKAKSQMTGTAGQKRVPKRVIEDYKIPVPEKLIQKKIVNKIESRLSVCDKIEESVESGLKKIEYLRQSILKKAFEGKLVPQDPKDTPAEELLKRIKIEKEKTKNNAKKKVKA